MAPKEGAQQQGQTNKRKGAPASSSDNNASRNKRIKTQRDARTLAVQTTSKAFKNGELDVGTFVKAREYEIRALEEGLARSKKALTQRAFQQVPKGLRRRTASHNAKRVPKRLRKQAEREMVDDNTPTVTARRRKPTRHMRLRMETVKRLRALGAKRKGDSSKAGTLDQGGHKDVPGTKTTEAITTRPAKVKKNTLSSAPLPPAKFRKRQVHKTWLPTHIYHAKRAHMTPPREPLWRFSIPLTSTAKSYRPTHRASSERGAIAWDTSYMSCISLEGNETSIQGVLKALSVGGPSDTTAPWGPKGQRWRNGSRSWQGWLYERDMHPLKPIAPATVIWRAEDSLDHRPDHSLADDPKVPLKKKDRRQAILRVHPAAFIQLWEQVARLVKVQKPQVVAEDLRFELGSIEITGPGSTEALLGALWPVASDGTIREKTRMEATWKALAGVTNPAVLPANVLLSFDILDPRLHHPPRTIELPGEDEQMELFKILADWPCDSPSTAAGVFDRKKRQAASRALPSQKAINRRKTLAEPGAYPAPLPQDARIPVLLYPSFDGSTGKRRQVTWVVLLPWKAVPPVWQSIMYYPLSSGGQVKLGGLQEKRQIAFESGSPWFPGDFPGTQSGKAWEAMESARRRKEWERRPKGKRTEWSSLSLGPGSTGEIGDGCACDWSRLVGGGGEEGAADTTADPNTSQIQEKQDKDEEDSLYQLSNSLALSGLRDPSSLTSETGNALASIRLTLLTRGVPSPCARIYRLPLPENEPTVTTTFSTSTPTTANKETSLSSLSLRSRWLSLDPVHQQQQQQQREGASKTKRSNLPKFPPSQVFSSSKRSGTTGDGAPQSTTTQAKLAADLLQPPQECDGNATDYPTVPKEQDLIGFVTSGEFCLTEGKGVGIGSILLSKAMVEYRNEGREEKKEKKKRFLCIVRNAGESVGRLAEWTVVG